MKKNLVIYGAGGLGKETILCIDENQKNYNFLGFIDDNKEIGEIVIDNYKVIGNKRFLLEYNKDLNVICAIANPSVRKSLISVISVNKKLRFPSFISNYSIFPKYSKIGVGSLIYGKTVATVDIEIGNFCIIDVSCTIGHDCKINDFVTLYPGVNISGCVNIDECVEIGTGCKVIQGLTIGKNAIIGAGAVIINDISANCTAVGVPAKPIKFKT